MNPTTPNLEPKPLTQPRKAVTGGSQKVSAAVFPETWNVSLASETLAANAACSRPDDGYFVACERGLVCGLSSIYASLTRPYGLSWLG